MKEKLKTIGIYIASVMLLIWGLSLITERKLDVEFFLGCMFVWGFAFLVSGLVSETQIEHIEHQLNESWFSELKARTLDVDTIYVDHIYVGRGSWTREEGWAAEGTENPRVKLNKEGMTCYSETGKKATGEKTVTIHGYGVFVEEEEEDTHRTLILPGEVSVTRHVPSGVGGRGAGGEARLFVSDNGARVDVFDYGPYQWAAGLFANLEGGHVSVYKDGGKTEGRAKNIEQVIDESSGREKIKVYAVDLKGDDDNGGSVNVYNWTRGYSEQNLLRATMALNRYGNGAVSTWDKNGYRQ